jgi:2-polyprenyl-3-methyl-5-hydroxy-6-metoxy-1,4-benzoquinol methylase
VPIVFTPADFESVYYKDPYGLPPYRDNSMFLDRAGMIRGRFATGKILIVGCGYGYTVKHLLDLGADVYGCDASAWAVLQAATVAPARVTQVDVLDRVQMTSTLTSAGLRTNQRFTGIITEDMWSYFTDTEVAAALVEVRRLSSAILHIVTAVESDAERNPNLNWKTLEQWKALLAPDLVTGSETGTVL